MNSGTQSDYGGRPALDSDAGATAIDAQYYNITDVESYPVAGLLVLLDGEGQPVRAELHVYDELPSHIHEGAVRQARRILQEHYAGESSVPVRILQTTQMRDAVDVRLDQTAEPVAAKRKMRVPIFAVLGSLAVVALILLAAFALRGSQGIAPDDFPTIDGATRAVQEQAGVALEMITDVANGSEEVEQPVVLPESLNARSDLRVGTRVAIVPGLRLTLRSEPGADAGIPVGYMMDEDMAVIVDGPHRTEGTSDTIVWWLVNLDDGTEAWAAANTSDKTLLIPAQ